MIGSISGPAPIQGGSYTLTVNNVTSTGQIAGVNAVAITNDGNVQEIPLVDQGNGTYQATINGLDPLGFDVQIAAFAQDTDGNISLPANTRALGDIIQRVGFE